MPFSFLPLLIGLGAAGSIGTSLYAQNKNEQAAKRMLALEEQRLQQLDQERRAMDALRQREHDNYQREYDNYMSVDRKTRAAEDAVSNQYQEELQPFKQRRQKQLNDPEGYYADQTKAMHKSRYGADAAFLAEMLQNNARGMNSSYGQQALRQSINNVARNASMGFDSESRERDRDAYNTLTQDYNNKLRSIRQPREDMLQNIQIARAGMPNNNDGFANLYNMHNSQSKLAQDKLAIESDANMILPQALNQVMGGIKDMYTNAEGAKLRDMQMKQLESNIGIQDAYRDIILGPKRKRRPATIQMAEPTIDHVYSLFGQK